MITHAGKLNKTVIYMCVLCVIAIAYPMVGNAADAISYKPPFRGAPASRVGGGTRGIGESIRVRALAPDHTGLTSSQTPSLYWYASAPIKTDVEFTLVREDILETVAIVKIEAPDAEGIQPVKLSELGISLDPDVEYQWTVAVIRDPQQRSLDVVASAYVQAVSRPDLDKQIQSASPEQRALIYANAGIWYDAVNSLGQMIESNQNADDSRKMRASLMKQIGLPDVERFDLGLPRNGS